MKIGQKRERGDSSIHLGKACSSTSITMVRASRAAPYTAVRTPPIPQQPGLFRVTNDVVVIWHSSLFPSEVPKRLIVTNSVFQ